MARRRPPMRVRVRASAVWSHMARLNVSQNAFARVVGTSPSYLSEVINGVKYPRAQFRRRLLEALPGATFDDLFIVEHRDATGEYVAETGFLASNTHF